MTLQMISVTPEELTGLLVEGMKTEIEKLKKSLTAGDSYLTRQETANLLKIDLSTLYNWTKKGKLSAYGIEGRVYYKKSDIDNAMVKI